jgi:hypothetical protein
MSISRCSVQIAKPSFLLIIMLLLTSCSHYVRLADVKELPGNKPVVFGRINVIEKDQPKYVWQHCGFLAYIILDAVPEPIPYKYCLTEDGSFYWDMPPGDYMITHLWARWPRIRKSFLGQQGVKRGILASFVVPEASALIYIGTLIIKQEGDRYKMHVEDHYDQDLQKQFTEISSPVAKHLMELR